MEKQIKLKTKDGHIIYGALNTPQKKSNKLVIFVHGFIGHKDEHIFFNGAKYFTSKGFNTFRFDLYSEEKKARHFERTKISLHGEDINKVVNYFYNKYKNIYLIGHSFGGTSLLFTDTSKIKAYVFWDASYIDWKKERKDFIYNKNLDAYLLDWGVRYIVGKSFINELKDFPDCGKLISKIDKPTLFVTAGKKSTSGKKYYVKANKPKSIINIRTSDHNFNSLEDEEQLFKETLSWIKKFEH